VTEEGERQVGVGPDPVDAGLRGVCSGVDGVGAQVGQLGAFDVAPEAFDGIEVEGVPG
jgi:hypothetical protein